MKMGIGLRSAVQTAEEETGTSQKLSHGRKTISSRRKPVQRLNGQRREENLRTKKPSAVRAERADHTKVNTSHILQGSRALHRRLVRLWVESRMDSCVGLPPARVLD